jgi:hypothetical protein
MRDLVGAMPATFGAAYPGRTADAVDTLTSAGVPWPAGGAIVWVRAEGAATRLLAGPPRGVRT